MPSSPSQAEPLLGSVAVDDHPDVDVDDDDDESVETGLLPGSSTNDEHGSNSNPHSNSNSHALEDEPDEGNARPGLFLLLLTFAAGISGLLFGCEYRCE